MCAKKWPLLLLRIVIGRYGYKSSFGANYYYKVNPPLLIDVTHEYINELNFYILVAVSIADDQTSSTRKVVAVR